MADHPILFSGPMVRAILEGRKTVTRRPVTSHARNMQREGMEVIKYREPGDQWYKDHVWSMRNGAGVWGDYTTEQFLRLCPFGVKGDRLWARETWARLTGNGIRTVYRADGEPREACEPHEFVGDMRWTPSIHMPRWASRLTLEVLDVRVERLQAITEEDAYREGVTRREIDRPYGKCGGYSVDWSEVGRLDKWRPARQKQVLTESDVCLGSPQMAFANAWDAVYCTTALAWRDNPWVWRIEFRRVEQ